jgi:hypothetical protein
LGQTVEQLEKNLQNAQEEIQAANEVRTVTCCMSKQNSNQHPFLIETYQLAERK